MPTAEKGLRAVPTTVYFVSAHEGGQVATESTLLGGRPCRGVPSGYFNSGSLPILPTSHRSLEADLGLLYQQLGSRPCP